MKKIKHSLHFVIELDESNENAKELLALPEKIQIEKLEQGLQALVAPKLKLILDELNANNSWAKLKVVE
jgi:hypothetical protein